jgi:hypothetical protein
MTAGSGASATIGSGSGAGAGASTGAGGFAVLTRRGAATGAAGLAGSGARPPGFFRPPRWAGPGVSANDAFVGTLMFRCRACLVTNSRATTSSIVLDALFTSMPWSFFRSDMTSWLERLRSSATL